MLRSEEKSDEVSSQTNGSTKAFDSETNLSVDKLDQGEGGGDGEINKINHKVNGNNGSAKELSEDGSNNNDVKSIIFA